MTSTPSNPNLTFVDIQANKGATLSVLTIHEEEGSLVTRLIESASWSCDAVVWLGLTQGGTVGSLIEHGTPNS